MPLTNSEFARLDAARVNSVHHRQTGDKKRILQLAFEHLEDLQSQQAKALKLIQVLISQRNKSWCFRVPRFFAINWKRMKSWLR